MDFNIGGGDALIEQGCSSRFVYVGQHVQAVHVVARSWMRRVCACIRGSSGVQSGCWPCTLLYCGARFLLCVRTLGHILVFWYCFLVLDIEITWGHIWEFW